MNVHLVAQPAWHSKVTKTNPTPPLPHFHETSHPRALCTSLSHRLIVASLHRLIAFLAGGLIVSSSHRDFLAGGRRVPKGGSGTSLEVTF